MEALRDVHAAQPRRDPARGWRQIPGVSASSREGTFYCLPDFSAHLGRAIANDSFELSMFLLAKARVVTVPGKDFGAEGHLRLSYAGRTEDVVEGVAADPLGAGPVRSTRDSRSATGRVVRDWL